jgi:hypothetical protein
MGWCPSCRLEHPPGASVCPGCGRPLAAEDEARQQPGTKLLAADEATAESLVDALLEAGIPAGLLDEGHGVLLPAKFHPWVVEHLAELLPGGHTTGSGSRLVVHQAQTPPEPRSEALDADPAAADLDEIARLVASPVTRERTRALRMLEAAGSAGREAGLRAWRSFLEKRLRDETLRLARGLARLGWETIPEPPLGALHDRDPRVRGLAAASLGVLGLKGAVPSLIEGLADRDPDVEDECLDALFLLTGRPDAYDRDDPAEEKAAVREGWREWWGRESRQAVSR